MKRERKDLSWLFGDGLSGNGAEGKGAAARGNFSVIVSRVRRFKFPFGPTLYKHFLKNYETFESCVGS
jgi:hypothetical protein